MSSFVANNNTKTTATSTSSTAALTNNFSQISMDESDVDDHDNTSPATTVEREEDSDEQDVIHPMVSSNNRKRIFDEHNQRVALNLGDHSRSVYAMRACCLDPVTQRQRKVELGPSEIDPDSFEVSIAKATAAINETALCTWPQVEELAILGNQSTFGPATEVRVTVNGEGGGEDTVFIGVMKCIREYTPPTGRCGAAKEEKNKKMFEAKVDAIVREIRKLVEIRDENDETHENIVKYYYALCDPAKDGLAFIMERAYYGSLCNVLTQFNGSYCKTKDSPDKVGNSLPTQNWIPLSVAVSWLQQLASVLCYLSNKGISHRNIKPDNLLIREDLSMAVSDFGGATNQNSTTKSDMITHIYACPLSRDNEKRRAIPSPLRDMYSFGVTALTLLTQQRQKGVMSDQNICYDIYSRYYELRINQSFEPKEYNAVQILNSLLRDVIKPSMEPFQPPVGGNELIDLSLYRLSPHSALEALHTLEKRYSCSITEQDKSYFKENCRQYIGESDK